MSLGNPLGSPLGNPLGLARNSALKQAVRGEVSWTVPGTYQWVVPPGVRSICCVAISGGGGFGNTGSTSNYFPGNGGALAYGNDIAVSPGQVLTVVVGAAGYTSGMNAVAGGTSYLSLDGGASKVVNAPGGGILGVIPDAPTPNGKVGGRTFGNVSGGGGGGGAGGYTTAGGNGGSNGGTWYGDTSLDGGAGGSYNNQGADCTGGGSWLYGASASRSANQSSWGATSSGLGPATSNGNPNSIPGQNFNLFFGGGAGGTFNKPAGTGALRILWGAGRAFPSTDVGLPV